MMQLIHSEILELITYILIAKTLTEEACRNAQLEPSPPHASTYISCNTVKPLVTSKALNKRQLNK